MAIRHIGVVFDPVGAYGRGVFRGINRYRLLARNWQLKEPPLWGFWEHLDWEHWPVDGYIAQITEQRSLEIILQRGLPVVDISGSLPSSPLPKVLPDDLAIGRLAAEHFLERGYRHFAFLGHRTNVYCLKRTEGFGSRLQQAGFSYAIHDDWYNQDDSQRAAWLRSLPKPMALFAATDVWASSVLQLCREIGMGVPEEMAILGVDHDELFRDLAGISLSSIEIPVEELGYRSAALLDALMHGETPPRRPLLLAPTRVVALQSTGGIAMHDPEIGAAARYIREHSDEPIGVEDVMRAAQISRRSLQRRFLKVLGRTPAREIGRVRSERVKQLLAATDLKMTEIARRCGFVNAKYMATAFRKHQGISPDAYRRQHGAGKRK